MRRRGRDIRLLWKRFVLLVILEMCREFVRGRDRSVVFFYIADFCRVYYILLLVFIIRGSLFFRGGEIRGVEFGGRGGGLCYKKRNIRFFFFFNFC